jgi:hypothetical protein
VRRPSALLRWIRASIKTCGTVIVRRLGARKERCGWDVKRAGVLEEKDMARVNRPERISPAAERSTNLLRIWAVYFQIYKARPKTQRLSELGLRRMRLLHIAPIW